MSDQNFQDQKSQQRPGQKVITGILVLTGFASLATQSPLMSQLARNLEQYLIPSAEAKTVGAERIAISDEQLIKELGADTLVIDGKTAFVVNQAGEKKAASSGYYKLSNGLILKVKDGQVTNQPTLNPAMAAKPTEWIQGTWKRSWPRSQAEKQPQQQEMAMQSGDRNAESQGEVSNLSVRDTLNKIIGA